MLQSHRVTPSITYTLCYIFGFQARLSEHLTISIYSDYFPLSVYPVHKHRRKMIDELPSQYYQRKFQRCFEFSPHLVFDLNTWHLGGRVKKNSMPLKWIGKSAKKALLFQTILIKLVPALILLTDPGQEQQSDGGNSPLFFYTTTCPPANHKI